MQCRMFMYIAKRVKRLTLTVLRVSVQPLSRYNFFYLHHLIMFSFSFVRFTATFCVVYLIGIM